MLRNLSLRSRRYTEAKDGFVGQRKMVEEGGPIGARRGAAQLQVVGLYCGDDTTDCGFCQVLAAASFAVGLSCLTVAP